MEDARNAKFTDEKVHSGDFYNAGVEFYSNFENQPVIEIGHQGEKRWTLNGQLHREDGPAIEWKDGTKEWYLNGQRHREDGPACEWANGSKEWWQHGKWHRVGAPAIEYANGEQQWALNGKWHREDGPARIFPPRHPGARFQKEWWQFGKKHRIDGPAVEYFDGSEKWFIEGEEITKESPKWPSVLRTATELIVSACLFMLMKRDSTDERFQKIEEQYEEVLRDEIFDEVLEKVCNNARESLMQEA